MVKTKITFTSIEMEFPNIAEFENYCHFLLGRDKFLEFSYLLSDAIVNNTMLPCEKCEWSDDYKHGFIQRYHENSLHSREFQLNLTKSPAFVELQHLLGAVQISVSIEMLPADQLELDTGILTLIDINSPGVLVRPGK